MHEDQFRADRGRKVFRKHLKKVLIGRSNGSLLWDFFLKLFIPTKKVPVFAHSPIAAFDEMGQKNPENKKTRPLFRGVGFV